MYKDIFYKDLPMRVYDDGRVIVRQHLCSGGYWVKERTLTFFKAKNGYLFTPVNVNGKQRIIYAHRVLAIAFIPNPDNLPQVNHKNEDKSDNRLENLEWCSRQYNINYSYRRHHATGHPRKACAAYLDGVLVMRFDSAAEAARHLNEKRGVKGKVGRGNISAACRGELKTAYGYTWTFIKD